MPWKETCPVHERLKFIAAASGDESVAALCRAFGVSRKTAYKWLARYEAEGPSGLEDRPRAVRTHPNAISADVAALVERARREHPTRGPRKLTPGLRCRHP